MNLSTIYALCVCGVFVFLLVCHLITTISNHPTWLLRHIVYPVIYRRWGPLPPMTRLRAIALSTYTICTVFCNFYGVSTTDEASSRAAWLSTVNMIPLFVTGRINTIMHMLGLSLQSVLAAHELTKAPLRLRQHICLFGFTAAILFSVAVVTLLLRRSAYELSSKGHIVVALTGAVYVYLHPTSDEFHSRWYALMAIVAYATLLLAHMATVIVQSLLLKHHRATAHTTRHGEVLQVHIDTKDPLELLPGQFVNLCVPSLGIWSILQSRSFMVSWQEGNRSTLLVQQQRGFSHKLKSLADRQPCVAWIDGPYGKPPDFGSFEALVFVAQGIGIAAHILAIKDVLTKYNQRQVKTRSVHLYWWMEDETNQNWVEPWFNVLVPKREYHEVKEDTILKVFLLTRNRKHSNHVENWSKDVKKFFNLQIMLDHLETDIGLDRRKLLVAVCAGNYLREETRALVQRKLKQSPKMVYYASDFQISTPWRPWTRQG